MEFAIEIRQTEDRTWKFRIERYTMWNGGFKTYQQAYEAAVIELAKEMSNQP